MVNGDIDLFRPRSLAIVGASREPGKVGHAILKNVINSGFQGKVYPINPKAEEVLGIKAYKSVLDVPDDIDLAVIVVPASIALDVAEECGRKGVKNLIVISAGFKEIGGDGVERERRLLDIARKYGMRMVGPNCLGIIDTYTPINASFSATMPRRGNIAFISQSGALLTAILDWSIKKGIGFSRIVSLGNKADLNEADFIQAVEEDVNTRVVLLYLESIENGRHLIEVAGRVSRKKPIVLLKGGVTEAGARAAMSHTGAMVSSIAALEAGLRKAGILIARNLSELFDYAIAFSCQPVPMNNRIAVVTNAGGPGVVTSDMIVSRGLRLASLAPDTVGNLRSKLPPAAAVYNPVDVLGDARADRYSYAIETVLNDDNVDGLVVILTPQAMTEPVETARAMLKLNKKYPNKPMIGVFIGGDMVEEASRVLIESGIPVYDLPERGVAAIYGMCRYRENLEYLEKISERATFFDVDRATALSIISSVRGENRRTLLESEAKDLVRSYGIPVAPTRLARNEDEAVDIAAKLGYPVVLKIASPDIMHKTDIGGVVMNLNSEREVRDAFRTIIDRAYRYAPKALVYGVVVQKMVPRSREVIIGVSRDPVFGHVIMFGLGGIYTNIFKDVSFRLAPLSVHEAKEMVSETKAYTLLRGYRGEEPSDISSIINTLLRVSQLVSDIPDIVEMDINPLFVYGEGMGSLAIDVKVVLS
ncbi:MAG: acetate--CoA ligase [Ignisphaera sp.]|nr:acetate--CoA ligase [Ignisphaera sp.]MDW8084871.1 acetate--CoA ligase [Ignisphaera sp.]